jgi:hypothetical protein
MVISLDLLQSWTGASMLGSPFGMDKDWTNGLDVPRIGVTRTRTNVVVPASRGMPLSNATGRCLPSALRVAAVTLAARRARRIDGQPTRPDARTMYAQWRRSGVYGDDSPGCAKAVRPGHAHEPPAALPDEPGWAQGRGSWHAAEE